MIFYTGVTGGLGRYLASNSPSSQTFSIKSRLEDHASLRAELRTWPVATGERVTLLHMAAKVPVGACEADPHGAFKTNVEGSATLVDTFSQWASERYLQYNVVYVSSGHVYAASDDPLTEDSPLNPRSIYARTKLAAEYQLQALAKEYGFPLTIARVFGLLAPVQRPEYLLPSLIRRMRARDMSPIIGLDNVRDWLDARDVCRVLVELCTLKTERAIEIVNVCSGSGYLVRDLASHVFMQLYPNTVVPNFERGEGGDVPIIVGDLSKSVSMIGRRPQTISKVQTIADAVEASKWI